MTEDEMTGWHHRLNERADVLQRTRPSELLSPPLADSVTLGSSICPSLSFAVCKMGTITIFEKYCQV